MASPAQQNPPPVKFAAALFPGFQALDLFGPLDTLNLIGRQDHAMSLYVLHSDLSPVSTMLPPSPSAGPRGRASKSAGLDSPMSQSVQPTHTYDTCPDDVEVLIVPGGYGCHDPAAVEHVAAFIRDRMPRLRFLLTICTGSVVAAQAGVLEGRRATCNKRAMDWVCKSSLEFFLFLFFFTLLSRSLHPSQPFLLRELCATFNFPGSN